MSALPPNPHVSLADGRIAPSDLLCSTDCCYEVQAFLGEGSFGQVARCREVDTNMEVAIKIFKNHPDHVLMAEVAMLRRISKENPEVNHFVRWYEWFQYGGHTCLVFELLELSLFDYMAQIDFSPMPLKDIRPILQQLAIALKKLKSLGLIHTDIKPENVMLVAPVGQPFRVKIIDFGLACDAADVQLGSNAQTRFYRSPEVLLGLPFSEAIDMWSLGCVAAGLFLGRVLYPGRSPYEMMRYITQTQGQLADDSLSVGAFTNSFFVRGQDWNVPLWRLKTREEYKGDRNLRSKEIGRYIFGCLDELKEFKLPSNLEPTEMMAEVQDREVFVDLVKQMLQLDANWRITPLEVLDHPFITMSHLIKREKSGFHTLRTPNLLPFSSCEMAGHPVIPSQGDMDKEDRTTSSHVTFDPSKGVTPRKPLLKPERVTVGSVESSPSSDPHQAALRQSMMHKHEMEEPPFVQTVKCRGSDLVREEDGLQERELSSFQQKLVSPKKEQNVLLPPSPLPDPTADASTLTTRGRPNKRSKPSPLDSEKAVCPDIARPSQHRQDGFRIPRPVQQGLSLQSAPRKRKRMERELPECRNRKKMKLDQRSPVRQSYRSPDVGGAENRQHGRVAKSPGSVQQIIPAVKMEQNQSVLPPPSLPHPSRDVPCSDDRVDIQRNRTDKLSSALDGRRALPLPTNQTWASQQGNIPNLTQQTLQDTQWERKRINTETTGNRSMKETIAELVKFFLTSDVNGWNENRKRAQNEFGPSFLPQMSHSSNTKEMASALWRHSSSVPDPVANSSPSTSREESMLEEADRHSCCSGNGEAMRLTVYLHLQGASTASAISLFYPDQRERSSQRTRWLSDNAETPPTASVQPGIKPRAPAVTVPVRIPIPIPIPMYV